ncbi:MAG: hypothetical protein IPP32_17910 [Bacteroidetes bacterium]|nr:hypothetical protein [Bacteroidota bacterium]
MTNNFNLNEYRKWDEIVMGYRGAINQDLIIMFLKLAETKIYPKYKSPAFRRKIFSVLIETLQNIHKYAIPDETGFNNAYFLVKKTPQGLQVATGNLVNSEAKSKLETKIALLENASISELKDFSKKKLFEERNPTFDSVGVGLFDLAIKSDKKLTFKFHPAENGLSFFTLEVELENN